MGFQNHDQRTHGRTLVNDTSKNLSKSCSTEVALET